MLGVFSRPMLLRSVRAPMVRRMYSDKAAEDQKQETASEASAPESAEAEDPVAKQLQEKDARIKDLTDDLLYCKAELQNVQRRTAEEKKTMGDHAISRLAKDLTESVDVLDLALRSVPEPLRTTKNEENEASRALVELYDGVSLTRKSILDMLRTHGIEAFDPLLHEALYQAPAPGKEPGSVLDCSKIGYMIKGRLLRAAQVGVVQDTA